MNCPNCNTVITEPNIPENYRPLSAWSYFWLSVLFSVPVVGFVFLIVFSFSSANIHRRSYARSYWCSLLIFGVLFAIIAAIIVAAGISVPSLMQM